MASVVYILGSITSLLCAILLFRGYRVGKRHLLLWSGLCFSGLALANLFVFVDLIVLPQIDLYPLRLCVTAASMLLLLFGLVLGEQMIHLVPFLLGVIAMASVTAAVFFLKFWKITRDTLFLAFAVFFFIDSASRVTLLFFAHPNEGSPLIYLLRLFALLFILAAILKQKYGPGA